MMHPLEVECYRKAWAIINPGASNLFGVIYDLPKILTDLLALAQLEGHSKNWVQEHPVLLLIVSQMATITRCNNTDRFHEAYNKLREVLDIHE